MEVLHIGYVEDVAERARCDYPRMCETSYYAKIEIFYFLFKSLLCFTAKEYVEDLALIPRDTLKNAQVRRVVITCAHWKHLKVTNFS